MSTQTIRIARNDGNNGTAYDEVDADCDGAFAIHEAIPVSLGDWALTHIPTGWSCFRTRTHLAAVAARAELLAAPGCDWSFTNPREISAECKRVGKSVKARYEGK